MQDALGMECMKFSMQAQTSAVVQVAHSSLEFWLGAKKLTRYMSCPGLSTRSKDENSQFSKFFNDVQQRNGPISIFPYLRMAGNWSKITKESM